MWWCAGACAGHSRWRPAGPARPYCCPVRSSGGLRLVCRCDGALLIPASKVQHANSQRAAKEHTHYVHCSAWQDRASCKAWEQPLRAAHAAWLYMLAPALSCQQSEMQPVSPAAVLTVTCTRWHKQTAPSSCRSSLPQAQLRGTRTPCKPWGHPPSSTAPSTAA